MKASFTPSKRPFSCMEESLFPWAELGANAAASMIEIAAIVAVIDFIVPIYSVDCYGFLVNYCVLNGVYNKAESEC